MVEVFREVRRVLRDDGTLWLNLGDSYNGIGGPGKQDGGPIGPTAAVAIVGTRGRRISGLKPKDLVGIPWRVAFALQADGWWLRQDIIWHKPNPMPESVRDRCTKAHEYVFLLTKSERYYYDAEAVKEAGSTSSAAAWYRRNAVRNEKPAGASTLDGNLNHQSGLRRPGWQQVSAAEQGRNRRSVWTITTKPYRGAHFAVMPPDLVEPCIKAGCPAGGVVLDPFAGSGTTLAVAAKLGRDGIGCELNPAYITLAKERIAKVVGCLFVEAAK
jgi:DNA modification methylase